MHCWFCTQHRKYIKQNLNWATRIYISHFIDFSVRFHMEYSNRFIPNGNMQKAAQNGNINFKSRSKFCGFSNYTYLEKVFHFINIFSYCFLIFCLKLLSFAKCRSIKLFYLLKPVQTLFRCIL